MRADVDVAALSVKDALDLAILIEEEAEERYRELAENLELHNTTRAAGFFRVMVKREAQHGAELASKRRELFGEEPASVDRSMLWEVEAPAYSESRVFMSVHDALEVALAAETKAFEFFDRALPQVSDPEVRELFSELRQEEVEHMELVRRQMAKADEADGFDPDDFADPPVAQ